MKPKYLVYRTDTWYDGCDNEETLKWAEHYFNKHFEDIKKGQHGGDEDYLIFAKVVKCFSFKEIQSSGGKGEK